VARSDQPVETAPPPAPAWRLWRPRRTDLVPLALVLVIVAASAALVMRKDPRFGPIDEFQHFNYITAVVYHHRIPVPGDTFTQQAMRAHACHAARSATGPACHSLSFNPSDFENGGHSTAGGYPPAYYLPTAAVAWVVYKLSGSSDLFLPARMASLLWLLMGAALTYLLARSFAAGRWVAVGIAALAALSPMMLYQGSTVNPDSMSLLAGAGAGIAWLSLRAARRWRAVVALCAVLAFVALIKPNFLAVPIAVALAEVALAARHGLRSLSTRSTWSVHGPTSRVCLAAGGAVLLGVAWPVYFRHTGKLLAPGSVALGGAPWSTDAALRGIARSLGPLVDLPKISGFEHGIFSLLTMLINVLVVSGAVAAGLLSRRRLLPEDLVSSGRAAPVDPLHAVGYLAGVSLLVAAPVTYAIVAASGAFITYPPRYSMFVVPLGLVALVALSASPQAVARYQDARDANRPPGPDSTGAQVDASPDAPPVSAS